MEWMLLPLKRYADFSGRSRRLEFWMFGLLNLIVYAIILGIVFATSPALSELSNVDPTDPFAIYGPLLGGVGLLLVVWWLAVLIPGIAVTVRRLHDRNLSGWWYLGFIVLSFIPIVGIIASLAFLVFMLLDGTPGPNRFGPDPKGRGETEVFA